MAHIDLSSGLPGIRGLLAARPDTARPLLELARALLRPDPASGSGLSAADRELIAAYVSARNDCAYCFGSHAAAARLLSGERASLVDAAVTDLEGAGLDAKLETLLRVAGAVAVGGHQVTAGPVAAARQAGATDPDVHDTVLIAAAFCMYNRYVDGLATSVPDDYQQIARDLMANGYRPTAETPQPGV